MYHQRFAKRDAEFDTVLAKLFGKDSMAIVSFDNCHNFQTILENHCPISCRVHLTTTGPAEVRFTEKIAESKKGGKFEDRESELFPYYSAIKLLFYCPSRCM